VIFHPHYIQKEHCGSGDKAVFLRCLNYFVRCETLPGPEISLKSFPWCWINYCDQRYFFL